MKYLLVLLALSATATIARADCSSSGLYVFPTGSTVKQNTLFVIDGYASSQKIIEGLDKKYPVYLQSGEKRVDLIVKETLIGQFYLTQAILLPASLLETGLEYTLVIDSMPDQERLRRYNTITKTWEETKFTVIEGSDTARPSLNGPPEEIRKSFVAYGCGPAEYVIFNCPVTDSSEIIVRVSVKSLKTGKETTYLQKTYSNELMVGHGMCSGAFTFTDGKNYEATFAYLDASGNITTATDRIKFTAPVPGDGNDN